MSLSAISSPDILVFDQSRDNSPKGQELANQLKRIDQPVFCRGMASGIQVRPAHGDGSGQNLFDGIVLPCPLGSFGDRSFCSDHGLRYPYVGGSMAKGISSVAIVRELGRNGMLGFFGAAGLPLEVVEQAIDQLEPDRTHFSYGFNLIHSPNEPELEKALVELYIRRDIRLIEASAFLSLTLPLVRFRTHGIHRDATGEVVTPNRIIAKISREEIAARFMAPPMP